MPQVIPGLHHVTAISGAPQANVDFYTGVLGQRLVKRTGNFDDPETYHLYYGDDAGAPGTIMTFFPFASAGRGRAGPDAVSAVAYAVPDLDAAMAGLADAGIAVDGPWQRFGARGIAVSDPDGLRIELIEGADNANGGFDSVTLWIGEAAPMEALLRTMGYAPDGTEAAQTDGTGGTGGTGGGERRMRWRSTAPERGAVVDLMLSDARTTRRSGTGTVHHIAFRARDADEQLAWRATLARAGFDVTAVIDRQYFEAIYFRAPGGILFEIATDPPGFAIDEDAAHLGEALKLPARYEPMRSRIERALPPLNVRQTA